MASKPCHLLSLRPRMTAYVAKESTMLTTPTADSVMASECHTRRCEDCEADLNLLAES